MPDAAYRAFKTKIKKHINTHTEEGAFKKVINRAMALYLHGRNGDREDLLKDFFLPIEEKTGERKKQRGASAPIKRRPTHPVRRKKIPFSGRSDDVQTYTNMVDGWASNRGDLALAIASYFHFKTTPEYEAIGQFIDREFLGTSFQANLGEKLPLQDRRLRDSMDEAANNTPVLLFTTALMDSKDAVLALAELNSIEHTLDQLSNELHAIDDLRFKSSFDSRALLLKSIEAYMDVASDISFLIPQITRLFQGPHYAKRAAFQRRLVYTTIANSVLARDDINWRHIHSVKFISTYAMFFRKIGNMAQSNYVMKYLPDLSGMITGEAALETETLDLLRDYTDTLSYSGLKADQICGAMESIAGSGPNNLTASTFRCRACMALRDGNWKDALAAVERARLLLTPNYVTSDDKMIKHYLRAIEAICTIRLRGSVEYDDIVTLERIAYDVALDDEFAYPILIGIYDEIINALASFKSGKSHDKEVRETKLLLYTEKADGLLPLSTRDFCFFDISAIEERMSERRRAMRNV